MARHRYHPFTVDWSKLSLNHAVEPCAHHWVTNESIALALATPNHFDAPNVPWTENTHRANRIATIVEMMSAGVVFRPLVLRVEWHAIALLDGHHRLRAYQFLNRTDAIRVIARGRIKRLAHAVREELPQYV